MKSLKERIRYQENCSPEEFLRDMRCPDCGKYHSLIIIKEYDEYKCTNCGHEGNIQDDIDEQNYFWEEALWGYSEDEKGEVFDKAC